VSWIRYRRQVHKEQLRPFGSVIVNELLCDLDRQTRFATSPWADHSDQPPLTDESPQIRDLCLTPDETADSNRHIVMRRLERRERSRQTRVLPENTLVQLLQVRPRIQSQLFGE
jgi:hypothetical protein